jgi:GNAT superfamily N-acetyltransferase
MPTLYNRKLGRDEFVPNELIAAARDSGDYDIPADVEASFVTPAGRTVQGRLADVEQATNTLPFEPAPEAGIQEREQQAYLEQEYGDSGARAFGTGVIEGVTLGGYGAALRAIDPEAAKVEGYVERANPWASLGGQIVGGVVPAVLSGGAGAAGAAARLTPAGAAAALGTRIAGGAGGGIARTAVGLGVEGAIVGAGQGVHQLALEKDPLTFEHAVGTIGLNTLLGAGIGAGAGIVGKVAEKGLLRAKRAVDEGSARMAAQTGVADDLSGSSLQELKAKRVAEAARIDAEEIAPQRAALADEIATYRKDSKQEKWWLATKGDKDFAELNKVALKADKRLDSLTDDLKGLRQDPKWALRPLRQQEQRLQELLDRGDEVRAKIAAEQAAEAAKATPEASTGNILTRSFDVDGAPVTMRGTARNLAESEDAATTWSQAAKSDKPLDQFYVQVTMPAASLPRGVPRPPGGGDAKIGSVQFALKDGALYPRKVSVLPEFQRKGIATRMYQMAEEATGLKAGPALKQTDQGRAFSAKYRAARDAKMTPQRAAPSKIPTYDELPPGEADEWFVTATVPIEELKPRLISLPGVIPGRQENIRRLLKANTKLDPVDISITPSGKMFVNDGRHRLRVAAERGDDVEVRFSRGSEGTEAGTDPLFPGDAPMFPQAGARAGAAPGDDVIEVGGKQLRMETRTEAVGSTERLHVELKRTLGDGEEVVVGNAEFRLRDGELYPHNVQVQPNFQRQGLATRMYEKAEALTGKKIVPSRTQTPEGKALSESYLARRSADEILAGPQATPGAPAVSKIGETRLKALDSAERLLERNRSLQERIAQLSAPAASPRLSSIDEAMELVKQVPRGRGLAEEAGSAYAVTALVGLAPGGPIGAMAGVIGPKVLRKIGDWVFGRMGRAGLASSERATKAVTTLLDTSAKAARKAPPLATRVLTRLSFGQGKEERVPRGTPPLQAAYQAREREIMGQVTMGPDGKAVMRPEARERVYEMLSGVRALSPLLADRIETHVAAVIEYLASKLPRRPDIGHMQVGPDVWHPTELEMRTFARIASAVTDPNGVEERAAQGMVTPDEAEAYRTLFPERLADFTRRVVEALPTLRKPLSWDRRLALTVLTGVPMDPSLVPQVLRVMQSVYVEEPGTDGGMEAPRAQPAFGSMSREQPSPSQARQERTA